MKRAPGTGGIRKLSGKRRKPYQAVVTAGRTWRNGKYVIRQKSIGVFATRREAQAALEEYNRYNYNVDLRSIRFGEAYDIIQQEFTPSVLKTLNSVRSYCEPIWNKRIIDIRKIDFDTVAELAADKSKSTQSAIRSVIGRVFKWAMENDVIIKDASILLKFPKYKETSMKKSYTSDEISILLNDPDPIQMILLYSGMRINELLNMKTEDVFYEKDILCFHLKKAKTEAGKRIIPVHSMIEPLVRSMLHGNYLIEPHIDYTNQMRRFYKWNEAHGIKHSYHELRHTFATYSKSCGMDDFYRKALLGHRQNGITDSVYTDVLVTDLKDQIEKLIYTVT